MKMIARCFCACALMACSVAIAAETMTEYPKGKKAAIAFTFDDATLDQYEDALPVLEKHGVKAIFNVIPARVGGNHQGYAAMSWAQLKELVAKGHALGNHTWHHLPLVNLISKGEADKVREEIRQGHDLILEHTGYDAKVVTFPGNGVNGAIEKIVHELGYRCTPWRLDNWGGNFDGRKAAAFAEKLVREGGYKYVLIHGVRKNGGWAALNDPKQLDEIITALKANPDLYVGGFQELLDYRAKYDAWKKRERGLDEQVGRYAKQAIRADVSSSGGWNAIRTCGDRVDFEVEFRPVPTNILERIDGGKAKLIVDDFGSHVVAEKEVDFVPGVKYAIGGTLDKPGFLRLTVVREGIKPNFGGDWQRAVAFEPEKIAKTTPMPDDFEAFWRKARETAAAIPLDAQCEKNEKCGLKDHDEYRVSFAAPNGRRVYGYFRKPKDAARKAPLRVQVPGAGLGHWSMWPPAPKKGEAQLFMTVFPWAPWEDGNAQRQKYTAMNAGYEKCYGYGSYFLAGISDGLEAEFFYPVILGVDRAITWAAQQEGVDGKDVRYYGISQGGGFGLYLTYLNPLIRRAVVNVPGFADMLCGEVGHETAVHKLLFKTTDQKVLAAMKKGAPYFDTANFAAKITTPIRFVTGQQDWVCPPHTVYAAYNVCPAADKAMIYTCGNHNSAVEEAAHRAEAFLCAKSTGTDRAVPGVPEVVSLKPEVKREMALARPDGTWGYLHDNAIFAFKDRLFVAWYNCPKGEMIGDSVIRGRWSDDAGRTWSDVKLFVGKKGGAFMYVPPAFGTDGKSLFLFASRMKGPDIVRDCEIFKWNAKDETFASVGLMGGDFIPNTCMCRRTDGTYMIGGRRCVVGKTPGRPTLAVSETTDPAGKWRFVDLAEETIPGEDIPWICPEMALVAEGKALTAYVRVQDYKIPDGKGLRVFKSADEGRTWKMVANPPFRVNPAKPAAGILSDGRRYLIANAREKDNRRSLVLWLAEKGSEDFTRAYYVQQGDNPRMGLKYEWCYPSTCEYRGELYIVTSTCTDVRVKNSSGLTVFPIKAL